MSPDSRPFHGPRPASISTMPTTAMTAPTMTRDRPTSDMASLEETTLPALRGGRLPLQMQVCLTCHPPARRRAHDDAQLGRAQVRHPVTSRDRMPYSGSTKLEGPRRRAQPDGLDGRDNAYAP